MTWDETYEHELHNDKDRIVLQTRDEGGRSEPWTWIRTYEKGRVFYTAYGHDHRTWENPGFHALIERGIRWAAGEQEVFDSVGSPLSASTPFEFETDEGQGLPDYRHREGAKETINKIQKPLESARAIDRISVPRGFRAEVFAAEPDIGKPLCVTWDERGRLWVAETVDYPNDLQPRGQGRDRIRICEDTDGDHRADKFTVFAEGLSIPTGMAFARGGLVVHQAPDTLFLQDTDGDDRCDSTEVLFTGWGTFDTHAGPSNLRYGPDNWLYSIVGYSGFRAAPLAANAISSARASSGFGRTVQSWNSYGARTTIRGALDSVKMGCCLRPPRTVVRASMRPWQIDTTSRCGAGVHRFLRTSLPASVFIRLRRTLDRWTSLVASLQRPVMRCIPPEFIQRGYWNKTAFIAEPTGHLVATMDLTANGTDYIANYGGNLVASDDEWCAPIAAEVGPDGCVWVSDWYNIVVQHNPTPNGFETGERGAYETPLRDKVHGRIYRIVPVARAIDDSLQLSSSSPIDELIRALSSRNMFWRLHAQRLLVESGDVTIAKN